MKNNKKYVLITGASSGIGWISTISAAEKGFIVFAGVRKEEDAEKLRAENTNIIPIIIDVINQDSISNAFNKISEITGDSGLYAIVNNAGIVVAGPVEFLPLDKLRLQLEINVIGQISVIQHFLPLIRKARGRIINISSIAGFTAFPFKGAYAASKFAIEALSDSLRRELKPWNIPVSIVEPGVIKTPIWGKSIALVKDIIKEMPEQCEQYYGNIYKKMLKSIVKSVDKKGTSPQKVANAILHALTEEIPRTRYLVGKDAYFLSGLVRLPDKIVDWYMCKKIGLDKCKLESL